MDLRNESLFVCSVCNKQHKFLIGTYVGINYTCDFACARKKQEEHLYYAIKELNKNKSPLPPPPPPILHSIESPSSSLTPPNTPKRSDLKR